LQTAQTSVPVSISVNGLSQGSRQRTIVTLISKFPHIQI
jgi:hypothetical protein